MGPRLLEFADLDCLNGGCHCPSPAGPACTARPPAVWRWLLAWLRGHKRPNVDEPHWL